MTNSRAKGKSAELEVCAIFTGSGIPARRNWEQQRLVGGQKDGDAVIEFGGDGLPHIYAEVRRRERLAIPDWLREIAEKAGGSRWRTLIFRRSREPWHVAIPLDQYIELLNRARGD